MNGKHAKKIRQQVKKLNKDVFYEHIIGITMMPFWSRLGYCLKMAFKIHGLQKQLADAIAERKKLNAEAEKVTG